MSVRLYGRDVGNGSLAVVTRGFRQVLEGAELLEGFVAIDRSGGSEEQDDPSGALARDGIFTGNLTLASVMRQGARHDRHWVTVTPNSTCIPKDQLKAVIDLPNPRILSASAWGTRVILDTLREMGAWMISTDGQKGSARFGHSPHTETRVEVHTVHHGVSGFEPVPEALELTRRDYEGGQFRLVHFSTTAGERKGTFELVQAWKLIRARNWLPERAELLLVLDDHARRALQQRMLDAELVLPAGVRLLPRGNLTSAQMSRLLCHMHALVAPSRGEGFGLTVAEARACGVLTVSTRSTGHSAGHCDGPGTAPIATVGLAPIDDGPGALAPAVDPGEIAEALHGVYPCWKELQQAASEHAPAFREQWSWGKQLEPLIGALR